MADSPSDADLLRAYVRHGREPAFAELVRRHIGLVYRSALRQLAGDAHAAEDVAQTVFILLTRKAPRLLDHTSLVGWLHTTTRHVARSMIRGASRRRIREEEATAMNVPPDAPKWENLRPVIDEALGALAERDREALLLRYFSGLSFAAVGEKLGVAENAARMRVDRALERLGARLRRQGIDSAGAALAAALANEAAGITIPAGLAARVGHAAMSAAGTGAAAAGGAAALLSAAKLASLAFVALAAALVGTISYGLYARHAVQQQLAATEQQARSADAHARMLAREAAAAEQQARELQAAPANAKADAAELAARPAADRTAAWDPRAEGTAFLQRHPDVEKALRNWMLASARYRYAPFIQQSHLSPADAERFLELVSRNTAVSMPFGPGGHQLVFALADESQARAVGNDLQRLLGKQGGRQLYRYCKTVVARDDVTALASSLAFSDAPMTAEQASALTNAFAAASQLTQKTGPTIDWPALTEQARLILTPAQLPSFNTLKAAMNTRQTQMMAMSAKPAPAKRAGKP